MRRRVPLFLVGLAMLYLGFTSHADPILGIIFVVFGFLAALMALLAK